MRLSLSKGCRSSGNQQQLSKLLAPVCLWCNQGLTSSAFSHALMTALGE
jgi:hypothetical protein